MNKYRESIGKLLKDEGGYVKDPLDRGGETYYGISRRYYPQSDIWDVLDNSGHMDDRLPEMVVDFYKTYFWDAMRLSEVLDDFVAYLIFNMSVNQGKRSVTKKVQRILKTTPDGIIGPITIGKLNEVNTEAFVYNFMLESVDLYTHIINRDKSQKRFITGWLNRVMNLYEEYKSISWNS